MRDNFLPILVIPAIPHAGGIRFLHRDTQIDINPKMSETIWKVLSFANGYNDITTIAQQTKLPEDEVLEIFSELQEMEVVTDSREQYLHFHKISNYPTAVNSGLTQDEVWDYTNSPRASVKTGRIINFVTDQKSALFAIRKKRRSCRSFSNQKLTKDQIGNICHFAYAIHEHSVPSGGALYPLKIFVLVEKPQDELEPGYYEYDAETDSLIQFSTVVDEEQLKYCFNQESMPFNSSVQLIIAADLKRQPFKYANRGYRLTLIEVGHVAENISLYCAEQGLGACEMGGLQDEALKKELEFTENIWPILAIPIGYKTDDETQIFDKVRFVEENVGSDHPVKNLWTNTFGDNGSFFGATSTYRDGEGTYQYAGATSASFADAIFKATIEGYERWCSGQIRIDFYGTADQLSDNNHAWLDPRIIAPLSEEQAKASNVSFFTPNLEIPWTKGIAHDGTGTFIPSDIVFYGQKSNKNRIYYGHSSGIAAFSNYEEAKKRALVELIERDALMRNWYERRAPKKICSEIQPVHIQKRSKHWKTQGRKLIVLQMPSSYGWIFETIIISDQYPCFVSGAAATIDKDNIEKTIIKATQEAEYSLLLCLQNPDKSTISYEQISTPADHGKYYHSKENSSKISWLWSGEATKSISNPTHLEYSQLIKDLQVSYVDLSEDDSPLKVVRAFSPILVPINFGSSTAHYTHPQLRGKVHPDSIKEPHYFA